MRNSGEKKYGTRTAMGFKYLPAERNASEITIEILAKETKELNRRNREDVILVGEETQDSDSEVSSESCKYSIEALKENNLKPSKHTFDIPPKGSTIPADSIGGACKFISEHSSKVLESIFNRNRSNAATFKRTFKPIMSVYRTDEQKKNYESQDSCMCTCICDSDTKQKKKKEKKVKTKKPKKEKKVKKEKKEKKPKKRKSKSGDEFCPGYDPLTDSCQYSYRSSDFTFPDGQDDPNICDCVDDLDEPPRNYGTLDNNWVPCKCGRDCPANRKYILKKKTVNYTFSTTVDSWKPGMVKICCPICTTIDRPALKIMKTKSILAKTKYQAAVLFGCWPLCMLPFYMSQSLILLFCRACHTYLGHYDKVVGCVRPPDPIKHHIAQLIPHHHHIK